MYDIFGNGKEVNEEDFIVDLCVPEEIGDDGKIVGINKDFSDQVKKYFGDPYLPFEEEYCKRVARCILKSLKFYFSRDPFNKENFTLDSSGELLRSYDNLIQDLSGNMSENIYWGTVGFEFKRKISEFISKLNPYKRYIINEEKIPERVMLIHRDILEYSEKILSVLDKNPWMYDLKEDSDEISRILSMTLGGDSVKLLYKAIVCSYDWRSIIEHYRGSLETVMAIQKIVDGYPYHHYLPMSTGSETILFGIFREIVTKKYNINNRKPLV